MFDTSGPRAQIMYLIGVMAVKFGKFLGDDFNRVVLIVYGSANGLIRLAESKITILLHNKFL